MMKTKIPWVVKHKAASLAEIKGQEKAVYQVRQFLNQFPKKRAIALHGPAGSGKTTTAYAIAAEQDAEILELNASDLRNKDKIKEIIGPASQQRSLFNDSKVILVDEVDGISREDRGGLPELIRLIDETAFPIIITANDIWDKKFNQLRRKAEVVELKELKYNDILAILKDIAIQESVQLKEDDLKQIAINSRGDARAAIHDLQNLAETGSVSRDERSRERSIFEALQYTFKNNNIDNKMIRNFDDVNMPIDQIFLWIEENIPLEYQGEELAKAFDALSKADVFRGRIYRQQHWRFLVYENFLLSAGIASAKKKPKSNFTKYKKPTRILQIWLQKQRTMKKKSICYKLAKYCHISTKQAMKDWLLFRELLSQQEIRKKIRLSDEENEYLEKTLAKTY
ncbi:MAG: replication factor C large subunit [Candidatus Nanoarchaeia archaeon]